MFRTYDELITDGATILPVEAPFPIMIFFWEVGVKILLCSAKPKLFANLKFYGFNKGY